MTLTEIVKGQVAQFQYFRDSALWYKTSTHEFLFPVPVSDIGVTTFNAEHKAIELMRWIRKYKEQLDNERV